MPWVEELSDPRELRRCIRDLVALSTLPAIWTGYGPKEIADSVATALVSMLEADFVYIALPMNGEEPTLEVAQVRGKHAKGATNAIGRAIAPEWFRGAALTTLIPNPVGEGSARIVTAPLGFGADALLVAGSAHPNFPTETQRLLLGIAANDATIALQRWQGEADQRRFVSLVERSSDFVALADLEGRPQFVNSAGLNLVGLSNGAEHSAWTVFDLLVPDERARVREDFWPAVLRQGRWVGELHFQHFKTGEAIPFLVDAFRIDNPRNGRPMNIATVSRDLRMQKLAEAGLRRLNETLEQRVERRTVQLADADRQLTAEIAGRRRADIRSQELQVALSHAGRLSVAGQMAAALAHELSQPLTAVANSANAARRLLEHLNHEKKPRTIREIMDEIAKQSLRAGQILRRLRDFVTRGESEKQVEDAEALIEEASAFARTGLEVLGANVQFKLDPNPCKIFVNRIQIQQVLVNIIRNAFEAMAGSSRRELSITTIRLGEDVLEIAIADTGPGLPREIADHLFEPFVSTKHDGMGLGLSICRSIVEAHDGVLRHEPNPEGGTIFRFTLPYVTLVEERHAQ